MSWFVSSMVLEPFVFREPSLNSGAGSYSLVHPPHPCLWDT